VRLTNWLAFDMRLYHLLGLVSVLMVGCGISQSQTSPSVAGVSYTPWMEVKGSLAFLGWEDSVNDNVAGEACKDTLALVSTRGGQVGFDDLARIVLDNQVDATFASVTGSVERNELGIAQVAEKDAIQVSLDSSSTNGTDYYVVHLLPDGNAEIQKFENGFTVSPVKRAGAGLHFVTVVKMSSAPKLEEALKNRKHASGVMLRQILLARVVCDALASDAREHLTRGSRTFAFRKAESAIPDGERVANSRLIYHHRDGQLRILLLRSDGKRFEHQLEITHEALQTLIVQFRQAIGVDEQSLREARRSLTRGPPVLGSSAQRKRPELAVALRQLSDAVIPPEIRKDIPQDTHLEIVPCGDIATVPFAALRLDDSSSLVEKFSVSIAPGFYGSAPWRSRGTNPSYQKPLVVGDPAYPEGSGLAALAGAAIEAEEVAKLVADSSDNSLLKGQSATPQAFKQKALKSDFIYVASHGVADEEEPLRKSFLAFAMPPCDTEVCEAQADGSQEDTFQQSKVSAMDVMEMDLRQVKLVVLSACQTGLGQKLDGGIIGLARAFLYAGAQNVVMSLWKIDDEKTKELMQSVMEQHIKDRLPIAEALRKAMDAMREEYPKRPDYWAGFSVFGTGF